MPGWLDKILGFFPDLLGLGAGIFGGVNNAQLQRETNETNMAIAKMTNAAQAREHEKAYERSKATNQVNLLQQAGMSKAGALQTLNGGGSYQPAPMQSSQAQAPQLDLSAVTNGLLQIGENARQRKAADKLQEKQIKAAVDAQKAQFEENEKERQHDLEMQAREHTNTNRNVDNRLSWEKEIYDRLPLYEQKRYDLGIQLLEKQVDMEEWRINDLKYRTLEYQSEPYKTTRDTMNLLQDVAAEFDVLVTDKELKEFKDTYMYYDDETKEWKYKEIGSNAASQWLYKNMPKFWDFISRVVPANKLADLIARGLSKK